MKLSGAHLMNSHRDDEVHQRAREMRITPAEVFARAYLAAGKTRSASHGPFNAYCRREENYAIPETVLAFCRSPLPTCGNPSCPTPKKPALFTKTDAEGRVAYFCSPPCMDTAPAAPRKEVSTASEGREILARVRLAMSQATYVKVEPDKIRPMKGQPRVYFNPERMRRLADSFRQVGQMTPGIIRRIPPHPDGYEYELLDGERRLRAARMEGLPEYRAMLVEVDDEAAPYVVSVIANFNREEHTLLELSDSVVKMHEGLKLSMYEIAEILGLSSHQEASNLYGLRRLIPEVRDMLDPNLAKRHPLPKLAAIQIAREPPRDQLKLAQKVMARELTVAALREHVRSAAQSRGIVFPERRVAPEERRRSIRGRIEAMHRSAHDLGIIMRAEDVPGALRGFPTLYLEVLRGKVEAARAELEFFSSVLDGAIREKENSR